MNDDDLPPWKLWTVPAVAAFGFVLAEVLTLIVYGIGTANGASSSHPTPAMEIVGSIVFDLGFIIAAVMIAYTGGGVTAASFGFRRVRLKTAVIAVLAAALLYYVVTDLYAIIVDVHSKDNLPSDFGLHRSHWAVAGTAIFVCMVAPMCEETIFRGYLFGALRKLNLQVGKVQLGPWVAAVITGILFGLAHTGSANPQYLVPLGFLGFVLCLLRWRTKSIYPGMVLHSGNNAIALGVQLHWSFGAVLGLMFGSWAVIAVIVGPLGARHPALA